MRAQTSHRLKVERGREGRGRDRSYKPASRSRVNQWRRRADSTWSEAAIEGRGCVESPGTSSEVTVRRPHLILPSFEFRREGTNERGLSPMNLLSRVRPIKATPPSPKMAVAAAASFLPSRQSDLFVISGIGACEEREGGREGVCGSDANHVTRRRNCCLVQLRFLWLQTPKLILQLKKAHILQRSVDLWVRNCVNLERAAGCGQRRDSRNSLPLNLHASVCGTGMQVSYDQETEPFRSQKSRPS